MLTHDAHDAWMVGVVDQILPPVDDAHRRLSPRIVVLDKLDYCASLHNLDALMNKPNFRVRRD